MRALSMTRTYAWQFLSMIVLVIDNLGVGSDKFEGDAPRAVASIEVLGRLKVLVHGYRRGRTLGAGRSVTEA